MIKFTNFRSQADSWSYFSIRKIIKRKRDKDNRIFNHSFPPHLLMNKYLPQVRLKN